MTQVAALPVKTQSALSSEPVFVQVSAQIPGATSPQDLASDTVMFAFKPAGTMPDTPPGGADWTAGSISSEVDTDEVTIYLASIKVGPNGTVTLTAGTYVVWVYLDDPLGTPVQQVGTLVITDL